MRARTIRKNAKTGREELSSPTAGALDEALEVVAALEQGEDVFAQD